jgi:hypothetical protein
MELFFQAVREMWSTTLWVNLNPEALLDGMENFIQEWRRFGNAVKQLPVAQVLDMYMKQFKNSVHLFVKLKNEALRERHWKELMDKTGLCLSNLIIYVVGKCPLVAMPAYQFSDDTHQCTITDLHLITTSYRG